MRLRKLPLVLAALIASWGLSVGAPAKAAQGSGCMPVTGIISGFAFSTDVSAGIAALISSNSGATAPATDCSGLPVTGQVWLDTSTAPNALRYYDGASWLPIGYLDGTNHLFLPALGGGSVSVASAATTDICANKSTFQTITGTASISAFGTACSIGQMRLLLLSGTPTLVHSANLLLPAGGSNIVAQSGDRVLAVYAGAGVWTVGPYQRADGSALTPPVQGITGQMMQWLGAFCPSGWAEADGATFPRSNAALFAVLSTNYGAGNGTTTANLPDMRGRFARGWDHGAGNDAGRVLATYQGDALGSHSHTINDPGHSHTFEETPFASGPAAIENIPFVGGGTIVTTSTSTTGITINATGAVETRPKNLAITYCVKL